MRPGPDLNQRPDGILPHWAKPNKRITAVCYHQAKLPGLLGLTKANYL